MEDLHQDVNGMGRLQAVERRVAHLDDNISSIGQQQAAMHSTLESMKSSMIDISARVNAPPSKMNWFGLIASVLGLVSVISAGVAMRVSPIEARAHRNTALLEQINEKLANQGRHMGAYETKVEFLGDYLKEHASNYQNYKEKHARLYHNHPHQ